MWRSLYFFRNIVIKDNPHFKFKINNFTSIDIGSFSAPVFANIDNDQDLDLFVGEHNGNISFFRNLGFPTVPNIVLDTDNFAAIDVGYVSVPIFADMDNDKELDLLIGDLSGNIHYYRNDGTPLSHSFTFVTRLVSGAGSNPALLDIDNDKDLDLILGSRYSSLLFINTGTAQNLKSSWARFLAIADFANVVDLFPAVVDIDNGGVIYFYENIGNAQFYKYELVSGNYNLIDVGYNSAPTFTDIDNDSDFDFFIGAGNGKIYFYRNTGTTETPVFTFETNIFASVDVNWNNAPVFNDVDQDGDFDLFVGSGQGPLLFYKNVGTSNTPDFVLVPSPFAFLTITDHRKPTFADIEKDGDLYLFTGTMGGDAALFRNNGPATRPYYNVKSFYTITLEAPTLSTPAFIDINKDRDSDLFIGQIGGHTSVL